MLAKMNDLLKEAQVKKMGLAPITLPILKQFVQ